MALTIVLALAGNAATSTPRWPWLLDELRQRPWWSVGVFGALAIVAGGVAAWLQLRSPAGMDDPPPPPPPAVPEWFVDRDQTRTTVAAVCRGGRAVGITTSLSGAGGFGKTTLANAVCIQKRVRRRFRSRIYFFTIGRDVRGRAAVAAKVAEATRFITGDTIEFDDPDLAGAHLGRLLDQRPRTLLVLDDVWEPEQLAPFLHGGRRCVRLVTTRNPALLPLGSHPIPVDQMSQAQAMAVLTWNLPPLPQALVNALLQATGRWALLLRLTNRLIAEQCATGADPAATAERILHRLRGNGPTAVDTPSATWNLDDPGHRNQAVKASIEAATTLLPPGGPDRFVELGIFAEDECIPVRLVARLWQASSGLTEDQTRTLCRGLEGLSLLALNPANGGTISLHDVIRDYLRAELGAVGLTRVNGLMVDTVAASVPTATPLAPGHPDPEHAWWRLTEGYLLDHLLDHMLAAGRTSLAEAAAGDLRWVEARLTQRGPAAPWSDLTRIDTAHTRSLAHSLAQIAHLLTPTEPPRALTDTLHTRLDTHPHWQPQITAHHHDPTQRPCLETRWPLPDAPALGLQRLLPGISPVWSVAVAPDGAWLASGGGFADGTVRIWDRSSGTCTTTLTGHTSAVWSVAVAPDGAWLASGAGAADGTVRIWDRASGSCTAVLTGHTGSVWSVAIAPDGSWLVSGGEDGTVRIWDRASGSCTAVLTGHTGSVWSVAIAPDGSWLVSGGDDGTVRIWDRASGSCTAVLTRDNDPVWSVAIAPDGTWLVSASVGTMRIWDLASGNCTNALIDQTGPVWSVAIAPDGAWFASSSGSREGTVRIWDRVSGGCTAVLAGHTGLVKSVVVAPDGAWLASGSRDGTVRIWDRVVDAQSPASSNHTDQVESVVVAPDGSWLASGGDDGMVRLWDRVSGAYTTTLIGHTDQVESVVVAPNGDWLASGGKDGWLLLWDRASGTCTATLTGHTGSVKSVAIGPDGTWLASGGDDGTVRIWDRALGTCTTTLTGRIGPVWSVAIGPEGTWLASGAGDGTVRIWDRGSGMCTATLTGHTGPVHSVAVAPDGVWLASGSRDGTVRIWDRGSGTCTATLTGHTGPVHSVAVAPDGAWLASGSHDGTVRIWNVDGRGMVALARAEDRLHSCAWGPAQELAVGGERGLYLYTLLT
ncbi:NB-ARC domain-containing protein [Streptomyces cinnamoneus]